MTEALSLDELDQLLDEIDGLGGKMSSSVQFYEAVLKRLHYVLNAKGCAMLVSTSESEWLSIASAGELQQAEFDTILNSDLRGVNSTTTRDRMGLVTVIKPGSWSFGVLAIEFDRPIDNRELKSLENICSAFAEPVLRWQYREFDALLTQKWPMLQAVTSGFGSETHMQEFAFRIVNDLAILFDADRVSLVDVRRKRRSKTLAISGVATIVESSSTVKSIGSVASEVRLGNASVLRRRDAATSSNKEDKTDSPTGLLPNYIGLPIKDHRSPSKVLVLEWERDEQCVVGLRLLSQFWPNLLTCWNLTERWLSLPAPARKFAGAKSRNTAGWRLPLRRVLVLVGLLLIGWLLCRPTTLYVQAKGTLRPARQRIAFASIDGTVSKLLISDGERVEEDQVLLEMVSPRLEIEIQGIAGEIRAKEEKRDGLNILINQSSGTNVEQSKWASEIKELDANLVSLRSQQEALEAEREKLRVRAPIDGVVLAEEIEDLLDSRPLRRGDPLLRVAQFDGAWRLEAQVADRDSALVMNDFFAGDSSREVDFVFASKPQQRLKAKVIWFSDFARNIDGEGAYFDLHVAVDPSIAENGHPGATAYIYLDCGEQPFWYVWSRPLVDFIQRSWWF